MGCSNPHPHGQVWATSYVPNLPAAEDRQQKAYHAEQGRRLLLDVAEREIAAAERVVVQTEHWVAVVPYWAAWPFETLHLPGLADKVEYAQLLNDGSELKMRVIDPDTAAQNLTQGGQPEGTLTLTLPVRRPDVAVPVIELFLRH